MNRNVYNKLVRDNIPAIIEASGRTPVHSTLDDAAYLHALDAKLSEELAEYQESKSMEELADLLEVMIAVAAARGSSIEEVETIRKEKAAQRGGFEQRIYLHEVISDSDHESKERIMKSILIKDTTREEREQIVSDSLGALESACDGCAAGMAEMYQDYIEGKRELREINREYNARYVSGKEGPSRMGCGMGES